MASLVIIQGMLSIMALAEKAALIMSALFFFLGLIYCVFDRIGFLTFIID